MRYNYKAITYYQISKLKLRRQRTILLLLKLVKKITADMQTIQNRGCSWGELFTNGRENLTSLNIHKSTKMVVQGHRGGFAPGNSLENFKMALDKGVEIIELDVSNSDYPLFES